MTDAPEQPRAPLPRPSAAQSLFRLNLEQQRKRAKDLQHALRDGDAAALARFRRHHPKSKNGSGAIAVGLGEAQLVVAREFGFPSWPKLKAHILDMKNAQEAIARAAPAPDRDMPTLHIRCGSDIRSSLKEAGFVGDFLEYADALCQGPVVRADDWLARRAAFLAHAYGNWSGRDVEREAELLQRAEQGLHSAAASYERVVLWFEHDSYDQLVLARCLAQFAETPPRRLELISVNHFPGSARFIGLGQLPPEAIRLLWKARRPVSTLQLSCGRSVWDMLRSDDPTPLATAANSGFTGLPDLAKAVRRHCQELPWTIDGLSLTERLVLQLLAEQPMTVNEIFSALMRGREPLPWLGDIMLLSILEDMKRATRAVFTGRFVGEDRHWAHELLTITVLGQAVLAREVDWLALAPPERWLGGVRIAAASPCWRWNDAAGTTVLFSLGQL